MKSLYSGNLFYSINLQKSLTSSILKTAEANIYKDTSLAVTTVFIHSLWFKKQVLAAFNKQLT